MMKKMMWRTRTMKAHMWELMCLSSILSTHHTLVVCERYKLVAFRPKHQWQCHNGYLCRVSLFSKTIFMVWWATAVLWSTPTAHSWSIAGQGGCMYVCMYVCILVGWLTSWLRCIHTYILHSVCVRVSAGYFNRHTCILTIAQTITFRVRSGA